MYHGSDFAREAAKASLESARAVERMKESKRQVDELNTSIARLDMIVCAMWELMQEQGITTEQLHAKIDDLILRRKANVYRYSYAKCPKCGKPIQESNKTPMLGRCVYCGETVTFYPYSDNLQGEEMDEEVPETTDEAPAATAEEAKPYDVSDDLGF